MASPASNQNQALRRERHSLESYYGRRLRTVAEKGAHPGRFSLWHEIKQCFAPDAPCSTLAQIKVPQESPILTPEALRPLLAGFTAPFSLEIHQDRAGQIQFQIGYQEQDGECLTALRALFGSHLGLQTLGIEAWNSSSGLSDESLVSYLLPTSSLYPLSFALRWDETDWVSLVLEQMKSFSSGPLLLQLLARPLPQAGQALATDVLAAVSGMGKTLESFRQELIRQRFGEPLCLFCLRLLGNDKVGLAALTRSLSALSAPFNHFKAVSWSKRQEKKAAQAVLERRSYGNDSHAVISLTELAGLWHPPLKPDYRIERALVREVATARLDRKDVPGRTLGFHTLRGETHPVVLPYAARNNHFCCFGKSQSGKSTALVRIAAHDIESGLGISIIDQHDFPLRILPHIPRERWDDIILISPHLMEKSGRMFPLNLFDLRRKDAFSVEFVCETLKEILGRAFTAESIGPRSSYIFDIATTALLKDPHPAATYTVLDLARVILNKDFRHALAERVATVDEDTADKLKGFDRLPQDSYAAPLNKLQLFSRDSIRPMIAAKENGFNAFRGKHKSLLDAHPIVICDLADLPHASAVVIGSIVLALLQLEAFRRNPQEENEIFHCYVDEAGAFLNLENADLITRTLTETAKFRMSLGLINQSYETIPPTVRKILSTNVAALMYFAMGIGSGDAKIARAELHDEFSEEELNRLPVGRAAVRLGGEVFSLASPDFRNPSKDQSAELIAHSLASKGIAVNSNNDSKPNSLPEIAQSPSPRCETPQTETAQPAEATTPENAYTAEPRSPAETAQNHKERWAETALPSTPTAPTAPSKTIKPVDLSKLQGQAKQAAVLRLLAVSGLVPLADLSALFFPDSPDYGRQFFKVMTQEGGLIGFVKLGKRLAYYLGKAGEEELKKQSKSKDKKVQPFILPEERLWEHAALVGSIATRFCALAARKGVQIEIERESEWRGVRPDLCVRWNDGDTTNDSDPSHSNHANHANLVLVEADRGTESRATFAKEKLVPYENAFAALRPTSGTRVRLLVVVPDEARVEELQEAAHEFPSVAEALRFAVMGEWPVSADITRAPIFHRIAQKSLVWG